MIVKQRKAMTEPSPLLKIKDEKPIRSDDDSYDGDDDYAGDDYVGDDNQDNVDAI
jgi:hypothetical protein